MKNEFKVKKYKDATVYTLESSSGSSSNSGSVASLSTNLGNVQRRNNLIVQDAKDTVSVPVNQKPRQGPLRPQTGGGAHRDKKKEQKQGKEKHRKPYMEDLKLRLDNLKLKVSEHSDLAAQLMATAKSLGMNARVRGTPEQERERTQQMLAQRAKERAAADAQTATDDAKNLPQLKAEYEEMKRKYEALGGSNWQYADREQNLSSAEREARSMEPALRNLGSKIARAEKAQSEMEEDHSTMTQGYGRESSSTGQAFAGRMKGAIPEDAYFQKLESILEEKQRLDPKCWKGYKKSGTKMKGGTRVNNCVPAEGVAEGYGNNEVIQTAQDILAYSERQENFNPYSVIDPDNADDPNFIQALKAALIDYGANDLANQLDQGVAEDWQSVNKKDKTDGMSRKAVKAYRRENPGSKLKTAVTTKPSKLKKGGKAAKRRKSFCARMSGMKKAHASAKTKRNPDSPINKALRRWNCEEDAYMNSLNTQMLEKLNPQDPVDVWVQDFQKADPNKYKQFKNKTPQKKAQMAASAHYAANEPSKKK